MEKSPCISINFKNTRIVAFVMSIAWWRRESDGRSLKAESLNT